MRVWQRLATGLAVLVFLAVPRAAHAQVEGVPCSPEPTNMAISYGDVILCDIGTVGDIDTFTFFGSAGETIEISAQASGSSVQMCIDLTKPDGSHVGQCGGPNAFRLLATLGQSGTHSFTISGSGGTTGGYGLELDRIVPPSPTAQPMVYGDVVTGAINPTIDRDMFSFNGQAGDAISIVIANVSGSGTPCFELDLPPAGTMLTSCSKLDVTLSQTAAFNIDVFTSGAFATAQYRVSLLCNLGPCVKTGPPSLVLTLAGCTTCHAGDTFTVQAELKNPGPGGVSIELKLGLRLPDGSAASLFGTSGEHLVVPLPAALDAPFTLMNIPWPSGMPAGTWSVEATVLEVALGKPFSRDVKVFQSAP
jgi:hypothetical protein